MPENTRTTADRNSAARPGTAYEVAVVGGGAAGLSAAVALARFDRSVVVIDAGEPRNAPAGGVHNLLTRDGTSPREITRLGRLEVERFGGHILSGTVSAIHGSAGAFTLDLADQKIAAERVIVATGGRDELPDVPGLAARWGKDVLHCPFCHGHEVRGRRIGILATSPMAVHQAMMFRLLSEHVSVLTHTTALDPDQVRDLDERGVAVVDGVVEEVLSTEGGLTGVRLDHGDHIELDALVVASVVHARADLLAPLGLQPVEFAVDGHVMATRVETGPNGATDVPGLWIAGNTGEPMAQVVSAAASGLAAGSAVIGDILRTPIPRR